MTLSNEDLAHVHQHSQGVWEKMSGKRVFLTGGTGFYGRWLVESLLHANERIGLNCEISILTRSSSRFRERNPNLFASPALSCIDGDIRDFQFPSERFDYLIHAAAETEVAVRSAVSLIDTEVAGFRRVFGFAAESGVSRVLFLSSGAVYGSNGKRGRVREDAQCSLDSTSADSRYGELKRFGELYGATFAREYGVEVVFARSFATFGPYQDLNSHFAIANFMRDAIQGRDIVVNGHGLEQRSYLYAADLAVWLWKLLVYGRSSVAYNVGSANPFCIAEVARLIASLANRGAKVRTLGGQTRALAPAVYVPNVDRARQELGLRQIIELEDGVRRTLKWSMDTHRQ